MTEYLTGGPIDAVFAALQAMQPDIHIERLTVSHPADDDNLWFINARDLPEEVQIASHPHGQPPFHIEGNEAHHQLHTSDKDQAATTILAWLTSQI